MRTVAAILLACVAGVVGGGEATNDATTSSTFAYDASAPLHSVDRGRVNEGYPIAVHGVSYALPERRSAW